MRKLICQYYKFKTSTNINYLNRVLLVGGYYNYHESRQCYCQEHPVPAPAALFPCDGAVVGACGGGAAVGCTPHPLLQRCCLVALPLQGHAMVVVPPLRRTSCCGYITATS